MLETLIGFGIWCMAGLFFIALGVYALFSKKAVGFWANAEMFQVTDAKKYNILIVPGSSFGCPGFVRMAYCVSYETIINALPKFKELAKEYF